MGENSTPDGNRPSKRAKVTAAVVPLLGVAIAVVGCIVAWSNRNSNVGWFAYAPLSNEVFSGNGIAFMSQGTQIGIAIMVAGLLVLAFWAGYSVGRRASSGLR
ncbi:hypothetical protein [Arthrobacter sp. FW306-06-A]|uniref:hypothetical protein n=1 Tax=Arthrobacter sp. FW306-06-A TaxID=2879621 RepID=UPI001F3A438F|nr:hypothetical protein [Arthrobacter sp. FW306-06-A]UKA70647.1 hypothetical protein LFT49_18270 [Arthrobacter sp. FW306-06-A]